MILVEIDYEMKYRNYWWMLTLMRWRSLAKELMIER
jgi:hypothetical protein